MRRHSSHQATLSRQVEANRSYPGPHRESYIDNEVHTQHRNIRVWHFRHIGGFLQFFGNSMNVVPTQAADLPPLDSTKYHRPPLQTVGVLRFFRSPTHAPRGGGGSSWDRPPPKVPFPLVLMSMSMSMMMMMMPLLHSRHHRRRSHRSHLRGSLIMPRTSRAKASLEESYSKPHGKR